MSRVLDGLFRVCGGLAAFFLAMICVIVLAQIVGRLAGVAIPSADEFAGYCLSASSFLALGYALRRDAHIRVTLLLDRLPEGPRRGAEIFCTLAGLTVAAYLTYFTGEMIYWSITFGDLTQGIVPVPLWIPQMGMMIGTTVLTLAFLDDAVRLLTGREPAHLKAARGGSEV
jgi:TRAP-type C4-dicarboxylate transport system permease small subunit